NYATADKRSDILGVMSEVNCAGILNRNDFHANRNRLTIPAQTWFDRNYIIQPQSSFDFWQVENESWRKIQVKSSRNNQANTAEYDPDIAVVYLSDHWPNTPIFTITEALLLCRSDDPSILGAAGSMQRSIDEHFQKYSSAA